MSGLGVATFFNFLLDLTFLLSLWPLRSSVYTEEAITFAPIPSLSLLFDTPPYLLLRSSLSFHSWSRRRKRVLTGSPEVSNTLSSSPLSRVISQSSLILSISSSLSLSLLSLPALLSLSGQSSRSHSEAPMLSLASRLSQSLSRSHHPESPFSPNAGGSSFSLSLFPLISYQALSSPFHSKPLSLISLDTLAFFLLFTLFILLASPHSPFHWLLLPSPSSSLLPRILNLHLRAYASPLLPSPYAASPRHSFTHLPVLGALPPSSRLATQDRSSPLLFSLIPSLAVAWLILLGHLYLLPHAPSLTLNHLLSPSTSILTPLPPLPLSETALLPPPLFSTPLPPAWRLSSSNPLLPPSSVLKREERRKAPPPPSLSSQPSSLPSPLFPSLP
ncbi:hypothetical protein C7M84_009139 [Penaeus vannamei]|uniref:Uncharacterized protein n=1 Tax=Penaeus vannamei TaxID=6689 RepID=A0A423T7Q0_PENVA|nr:hypothetical protein C7M84_009139 [Penaeus vannamei]